MFLPFTVFQHAAVPVAEALVAGLWQGIALAVLTGFILRLIPRTTAAARFAIWTAVFCASAAMPLVHLFNASSTRTGAASSHLLLDSRWSYLLAGLWIGMAIFRLMRLAVEAVSLRRLWREAVPLSAEVLESANLDHAQDASSRPDPERSEGEVERSPHLFALGSQVRVCTTPDVDRPSVIGFFAPKILIPDWLCAQLSATELRHIVLHEMEHLRRRDDWLNLLQKIGLVIFPLNPAMFWIDRRLATEREIACDDGVLARTNTPRAYAASLTSIAERRLNLNTRHRMIALALGAFGTGKLLKRRSEFARRIESILNSSGDQRTVSRPAVAAVLVAAIFACSAAISHAPELVSFRADAAQNAHADAGSAPSQHLAAPAAPLNARPHFENASFHLPATRQSRRLPSTVRASVAVDTTGHATVSSVPVKAVLETTSLPAKPRRQNRQEQSQWVVLTSWDQASTQSSPRSNANDEAQDGDVVVPVSRVILRMSDGRFLATPYAAVPTQAGWLIVQL